MPRNFRSRHSALSQTTNARAATGVPPGRYRSMRSSGYVSIVRLRAAAFALIVGCRVAPPPDPAKLSPGVPDGSWKLFDVATGFNVQAVAFSSRWPTDPFIVVTGYDD